MLLIIIHNKHQTAKMLHKACALVGAGKRYDMADYPVYVKLTGGAIQGYRGEYRDKIPLNRFGVAPVIIPSVGAHYGPVAAELVLLGFNAAMVTTGVRF